MRKSMIGAALLATGAAFGYSLPVGAQEVVKVGVLSPLTGPNATFGKQFRDAVAVYQKQHGTSAGGAEIEFIFRDLPDINPAQAATLATELIVQEGVQYLAGFEFTPNAIAVAPLTEEAGVPLIVFNAATSMIPTLSPYIVRTSYTTPQVSVPVAEFAAREGIRRVVTLVADYGPGVDAENAFRWKFEAEGGEIVEAIRMPVRSTDFSPFLQRVRSLEPDAIYAFLPAGPATFGFTRAYSDNGLAAEGIAFLGTAETEETNLQALGDPAIGIQTGYHYSSDHESELNARFLTDLEAVSPGAEANFASVGAYDGAHLIYRMVEATGGEQDADAAIEAVEGYEWESPRGPVRIDPETRNIVQNVYMRVVERDEGGRLVNREFETFEMQPDWGGQIPAN